MKKICKNKVESRVGELGHDSKVAQWIRRQKERSAVLEKQKKTVTRAK
jgi:hypothetical protein